MAEFESIAVDEAIARLEGIGFSAEHRDLPKDPFGAVFAVRSGENGRFAMIVPLARAGVIMWGDVTSMLEAYGEG